MTDIPPPTKPAGMYLPAVAHGGIVFSAGAIPVEDGTLRITGRVGDSVDVDVARRAAAICARNALGAVATAASGIDRIVRLLRVGVFVQCAPDFKQISHVADAATEALIDALGDDRARCARTAVGVYSLPLDAPVEVEIVAAYRAG
jgi:enamine deaminase RidA (YjgF/YER057c/UK114 family)